jgi:hypothetical protein
MQSWLSRPAHRDPEQTCTAPITSPLQSGGWEEGGLWTVILITVDLPKELLKFLCETVHFTPSVIEALPAEKPQAYVTKKHTEKQT